MAAPALRRTARTLAIEWGPSNFANTEYGRVGEIKAFSLTYSAGTYRLSPRLPDRTGVPCPAEEFRDADKAKQRAEEILREFLTDFMAAVAEGKQERTAT
ncbi:hypothetical protein [Nonomuraea sp. NPDC052265]|uniref:hypothetical protein n=1 Tax=Nonomuraea sp. NPDC052265 TaxID=3364374 RepID=UPI0037CAAC55